MAEAWVGLTYLCELVGEICCLHSAFVEVVVREEEVEVDEGAEEAGDELDGTQDGLHGLWECIIVIAFSIIIV